MKKGLSWFLFFSRDITKYFCYQQIMVLLKLQTLYITSKQCCYQKTKGWHLPETEEVNKKYVPQFRNIENLYWFYPSYASCLSKCQEIQKSIFIRKFNSQYFATEESQYWKMLSKILTSVSACQFLINIKRNR